MGWIWTVALNGGLGIGAYGVARSGLRQAPGLPRILASAVLAWAWLTIGMEGLGSIGLLARGPLLGWVGAGMVIGMACWLAGRRSEGAETSRKPGRASSWEEVLGYGLVVWATFVQGKVSVFGPLQVVSDGPIYHLFFAVRWWQEGRLGLIASPFGETAATYFPAVGDLWFAWLIVGWGGETPAKAGQIPFLGLTGLVSFALARQLGAGRKASAVATAWALLVPCLFSVTFEPNVDTIFACGYLLAAYFFLRHALGEDGPSSLLLGGLAAGCSAATKAPGFVFVIPLLALGLASAMARGKGPLGKARGGLIVLLAPALDGRVLVRVEPGPDREPALSPAPRRVRPDLAGRLVWARRDAFQPLLHRGGRLAGPDRYHPFGGRPATRADLAGVADGCLGLGPGRPVEARPVGLGRLGAGGVQHPALLARHPLPDPATVHDPRFRGGRHPPGEDVRPGGLGSRPRDHSAGHPRVFAPSLAVLRRTALGPGPLDSQQPARPDRRAEAARDDRLDDRPGLDLLRHGPGLVRHGLAGGIRLPFDEMDTAGIGRHGPAGDRLGAHRPGLSLGASPPGSDSSRPSPLTTGDGWSSTRGPGLRGPGSPMRGPTCPYYLQGFRVRNEVRYVNIDGHRDWLMHDYQREAIRTGSGPATWPLPRPGWDRLRPDYRGWLANLRAEKIQLLVVTRANFHEVTQAIDGATGFPIERRWADAHPEAFDLLYGEQPVDPEFRLYRIKPASESGG